MKIKEELFAASSQKFVFVWVPSHKGIEGNERADLLANEASESADEEILDMPITLKDLRSRIKRHYREIVRRDWERVNPSDNKLRKIKKSTFMKRADSVRISRLRLGHTRLTHGHLMTRENPKLCTCGDLLTVEHIFNDCPRVRKARKKFKIKSIHKLSIDTSENYENIIKFLKLTKLYYEI